MITVNVGWSDFKSFIQARAVNHQSIVVNDRYYLVAMDGDYGLTCQLSLDTGVDPRNAEVLDFEANFKAASNKRLSSQSDSDNATFTRTKQAPTGWTYQLRGIEFTTANPSSIFNADANGVALNDVTMKLYDAAGVVTTDPSLAAKTQVDFEPAYDYYIIGGQAKILVTPVRDVRLNVVAVPDVPFSYGGSRVMIQNVNFKYIGANERIDADGRASKMLSYSATMHTNKLRFMIYHSVGEQNIFSFFLEHYKI